jgi:hypothetical protein
MGRLCRLFLAVAPLLAVTGPGRADDARAVVERAVKAHGGADKLTQLRQYRERTRGVVFPGEGKRAFTLDTTIRLPDQFRSVLVADLGTARLEVIQVCEGSKGWVSDNGRVSEVSPQMLADYQDLVHVQRISALTPLLQDTSYQLTSLDNTKVQGKASVGVKVARKGRRDVKLYFDKDSGLLVKREYQFREMGNESLREEFLSDYKAVEGVQRPHKFLIQHDGKKYAEAELVEWKPLSKVEDREFAKP